MCVLYFFFLVYVHISRMHTQRNSTYTYVPMQKSICMYIYICLDLYAEKLKRKNLHARQRGAKQMKRTRIA